MYILAEYVCKRIKNPFLLLVKITILNNVLILTKIIGRFINIDIDNKSCSLFKDEFFQGHQFKNHDLYKMIR